MSEATLRLMAMFPPNRFAPLTAMNRFAKALMDDALLEAFHYRRPSAWNPNAAPVGRGVPGRGEVRRAHPTAVTSLATGG